jgi:xyloglucan-specific exo-beta-1,4-glucanase
MNKLFFTILILFIAVFQGLPQTSETYSWKNVAIGGGGFVSGVFFSPIEQNVIYARTDVGGAYRWNESAKSWISMMDWVNTDERGLLGIEALAIDPAQPGTVYIMAGTVYWNQADDGIGRSAFLRSQDYGQTWEKIPVWDNSIKYFSVHGNGMGRGNGERLAIDPANSNTMFYGTRNKGLWKSSDNGSSWTKVSSFPVDTTWNGCGISFVAFDPSTKGDSRTTRIYVGVLRKSDNVFVSDDAGATWSLVPNRPTPQYATDLMPQRIAVRPGGSMVYITFGNGAGPHTMQWDEGWGFVNEWFNRGAVFKYELSSQTWTDISPQDLIDPENDGDPSDPSTYYGCYSGISLDPNNPDHMVVSSIASYRGPQFWLIDGSWVDKWGDNIFVTEDGGKTWVASFQYYWLDGGVEPNTEQMDENGVPWIIGNTIHWIGSTAIDPYNPQRVFVTSGNGVFMTEDIFNYEWSYINDWGGADTSYTQYTVWKFAGQGIEEVVPEDLVSIPGGPLVSVIGDYDGFVHTDVTQSPATGRLTTVINGTDFSLGSTTGLAYAPQSGKLAKVAKTRSVSTKYNTIPIGPVQYSTDNGLTWTSETYTSNPPTNLMGGKVALSADGDATLWMPSEGTTMYRHFNSSWSTVSGISFNGRPFADQVNANKFYVYNNSTGYMYVSTDKGVSFVQAGYVGTSNFRTARSVPDNEGHIWVPVAINNGSLSGGLMRSKDGGTTFSPVEGVGYCEAVSFGKAAAGASYPAVFVFAEIDGILGVWRSIDEGASWVRVNDDEHEYGGLANGEFVIGDMNIYGRVYMSTAGRGIVYGDPAGNNVPVTGVTISPSMDSVSVGGTLQLTADIAPLDATNKSVTWKSENNNIATVSLTGKVTAVAPGTVTISVTTYDGGFTAFSEVTVSDSGTDTVQYTLTTSVTGAGSIQLDPAGGLYNEGTRVSASAVAEDGYHFVSWEGDASGTNTTVALTMDADKSITALFETDTIGNPCENPVSISIPFVQNGEGEFCFVTTTEMAYINSWNMEKVEINGVDFTNSWSNNLPDPIDGQWFIYYKGNYDWSHFEAPGAKSTIPDGFAGLGTSVEFYPNPFTSFIHITIENPGAIRKIEVLDNLGRIAAVWDKSQIVQQIEFGDGLAKGVYFIKVSTSSGSQTFIVYKN